MIAKMFFRVFGVSAISYVFFTRILSIYRVTGDSMYPTFKDGDFVFVKKIFCHTNREDMIAYIKPTDQKIAIKRIKKIVSDEVYYKGEEIAIPKSHVWVIGDNRGNSIDSRDYGPIALGLVIGNPIFKI
jgi:signal peptidase I